MNGVARSPPLDSDRSLRVRPGCLNSEAKEALRLGSPGRRLQASLGGKPRSEVPYAVDHASHLRVIDVVVVPMSSIGALAVPTGDDLALRL